MPRKRVPIEVGRKFGKLTVLYEEEGGVYPKGKHYRVIRVLCECGNEVSVKLSDITSKRKEDCGCIHRKKHHGLRETRLYRCWDGMKQRSKRRQDCRVCEAWKPFIGFYEWAMENGYSDDLILCRNGDKGDYEPDNCRWATIQDNVEEAHAKAYTLTYPCGKVENIFNLSKFSREKGYSCGGLSEAASGIREFYKGIKVEYRTLNKEEF